MDTVSLHVRARAMGFSFYNQLHRYTNSQAHGGPAYPPPRRPVRPAHVTKHNHAVLTGVLPQRRASCYSLPHLQARGRSPWGSREVHTLREAGHQAEE